ncbi:TAXI family TRAP transporter solute-binding subunit [Marinobacterium jannaschii]|uniref:TAXI family TRAP transporter solute-binding subunit n=1 Tax=Marinobacterium jannaschii TaxID=64970 RepID=UPI0006871316|nr:TAXI family TRAP transporter solute-binding subunit [Marinobacterium jannaschii]
MASLNFFTTLLVGSLFGMSAVAAGSSAVNSGFVTVGTGGVTGVYYPTGGAICRLMNKARRQHGLRCAVEATEGSVYNIQAIRSRELDFAIVQSDIQYKAVNGVAEFSQAGADKELRSVFSLYAEPFTLVARSDSGVTRFEDLRGKRINIGAIGSGHRGMMRELMKINGWSDKDFSQVTEFDSAEQAGVLCTGEVDAFVYTVGHPSGAIKEATTACDSAIIPLKGKLIERLLDNSGYYREAKIPGGMYRGNPDDIDTFGVGATLVVSSEVSEETVYLMTKAVFENFDQFRKLHPAFARLRKAEMLSDGLSAPIHPGALRYYRENRLLRK